MSAGRTIALVAGVLVTLASLLGLTVGGALAWLDQARRDSAGFVTSDRVTLSTSGYALTSEELTIDAGAASVPHRWFGDARVRVETVSGGPVFVGLASADRRTPVSGRGRVHDGESRRPEHHDVRRARRHGAVSSAHRVEDLAGPGRRAG